MENEFYVEQDVWDTTYRVNGGFSVKIVKIGSDMSEVWYPKGDEQISTFELVSTKDLKAYIKS